jgi:sucrose 6(F)-phosphate phosphorylase
MTVDPRPQLLTYPDSLGGSLGAIADLLDGPLDGMFRGVHVLPPFPSSGDRGFAPVTYDRIDPRFGDWDDIARIGRRHDVLLDLMVNHISRQSPQFQDFLRRGRRSPDADLFITLDKVWPGGVPDPADVARIFLRKPDAPFSTVTIADTGERERIWTSFGTSDWSEQIDLDVTSDATRALIAGWLHSLADRGVRIVRLDAIGYVIKRRGTTCFMVEPEIYEFLDWIRSVAAGLGLGVLPEVHDVPATHRALSARGLWTYDFVLPGLVLHALETGESRRLAKHLAGSPDRVFTTLDCHDGIPVMPDLDGVLDPDELRALVDLVECRGGNANRILSSAHEVGVGVDVHQLNCTYYSALDCDDERYVTARAIQLFARGIPQIYYVGLLAGENDAAAVARLGDGRAINRHDYPASEIAVALDRPVVRRVVELVRLRNEHAAFDGALEVVSDHDGRLELRWRNGDATCALEVDLVAGRTTVSDDGRVKLIAGPRGSTARQRE